LTVTAGSTAKAPTAITGSASATTTNTATLGATVNPNGADTSVFWEYGISNTLSTYSQTLPQDVGPGTSSVGPSANIAGLTPGTQYYFRVVASNAFGTINGLIVPFSTASAALTGPTAHFTMASPGVSTVSDGGTLDVTAPSGGSVLVTITSTSVLGSASSFTNYLWTINGIPQCGNNHACNVTILAGPTSGTVPITLTVTDSNGKQSSPATGTVFLTISNPTPKVTLIVTGTPCHGSAPGSVPEIDLSFTVSGGTSHSFDVYRNGTLLSPNNSGTTTFQNFGTPTTRLTPGQTYNYYVFVYLVGGGTATSNTVPGTAPSNCH
jgi:hypothetical protein